MRTRDFNALNDLLFKFIFGRKENKAITLSFINAVLGLEGARALRIVRLIRRRRPGKAQPLTCSA